MNTFNANFIANAGIKDIVGKGLIYDDSIAIIELVKNSKDAGSPFVEITFKNLMSTDDGISELIISDMGSGMTQQEIIDKWLNIAYSEKKGKKNNSEVFAGNKGVGRFSCDRLGKVLTLYTKSKNGQFIKLPIEWAKFENKGQQDEVSTIKLVGEVLNQKTFLKEIEKESFDTGTILKIKDLRSDWGPSKLKKLISELEKFSPSLDSSFEVYLHSDNDYGDSVLKKKLNKKINNQILSKLAFQTTYIKSSISPDGSSIHTTLFYQSHKLYEYSAKNPYQSLKNIKVEIHYLDTISKTYFTKNIGVNPNSYGSIFLFYNGFRISPYGNEKNDWLSLDQRKSQGTSRNLGTRDVFGRIDITDQDDTFSVITSREGLAHNQAYFDLVAHEADEKTTLDNGEMDYGYVPVLIRQLENFVVRGLDWNRLIDKSGVLKTVSAGDARKEPHRFEAKMLSKEAIREVCNRILKSNFELTSFDINNPLIDEIQGINKEKYNKFISDFVQKTHDKSLSDLNAHEKGVVKKIIEGEVARREEAIEAREKAEEESLKTAQLFHVERQKGLYLLATRKTLSQDAEGLIHTIKLNNLDVRNVVDDLIDDLKSGELSKAEIINQLTTIKLSAEKSIKMTELVTQANFDRGMDLANVDLVAYITEYLNFYTENINKDLNIGFNNFNERQIRKVSVLSLSIILDNLISNSIKWHASEVFVEFSETSEKTLKVLFCDNGIGLSDRYTGNPDVIFELGIRDGTSENSSSGSGIGLYYVKTLLTEMHADIRFKGNGVLLTGACFEMEFK